MTTKLCELNFFHSNTERKKQEVTSKMAYFEVQKWPECILRVEYQKYRKKWKREYLWECNLKALCLVSNFSQPRTGIKEVLWGGVFLVGYFTTFIYRTLA